MKPFSASKLKKLTTFKEEEVDIAIVENILNEATLAENTKGME